MTDRPAPDVPDRAVTPAPGQARWPSRRWVAGTTTVVLALVGAFLLALWLYGVLAHFLFLLRSPGSSPSR